jgi:MinD-like ATPase involved in chromosome partitioning or flagellar assembly
MDRRGKLENGFSRMLEVVASTDAGYDKPQGIVVGFISVCDFVENGEILSNLAYLLSKRDVTVCVVDFKVFYPNLFDWLGGVNSYKKGDGLIRLLKSDRVEVKSVALKTDDENVFLISPSPNDEIEDYFNFSINDVKRVLTALKDTFDVVLIDIPNNPPLEFCVGALMNCQRGFFVASERVDASRNIQKLVEYMLKVSFEIRNFNNIIITRKQDLPHDEGALSNLEIFGGFGSNDKLKIAARIPFLRAVQESAMYGNVYIRDSTFMNKKFLREIDRLAKIILEVG